MTTIKDIAREAKVSITTVSFAINGTGPVASDTKRRIMEVIERLNYQPNSSARGLVMRKTNTICLYVLNPRSSQFSFQGNNLINELLQGIGEAVDEKNYNLLLAWEQHSGDPYKKLNSIIRQHAVDGILFPTSTEQNEALHEAMKSNMPLVYMGRNKGGLPISTVDIDNFEAAYQNTLHLIKLGHERIAFVSPDKMDYMVSKDRFDGFKEALRLHQIRFKEQYFAVGDSSLESGYEAASRFRKLKEPPTAVVAGRDSQAVGIIAYMEAARLTIPKDLAIVSFENSNLAEQYELTSMATDMYIIGREATRLLLNLIGRKKEQLNQNIIIPSKLVIRKSCGYHPE